MSRRGGEVCTSSPSVSFKVLNGSSTSSAGALQGPDHQIATTWKSGGPRKRKEYPGRQYQSGTEARAHRIAPHSAHATASLRPGMFCRPRPPDRCDQEVQWTKKRSTRACNASQERDTGVSDGAPTGPCYRFTATRKVRQVKTRFIEDTLQVGYSPIKSKERAGNRTTKREGERQPIQKPFAPQKDIPA